MEAAFEEDANAKVIEIAELKTANEDLQDALDIVSKEAAKVKYDLNSRFFIVHYLSIERVVFESHSTSSNDG